MTTSVEIHLDHAAFAHISDAVSKSLEETAEAVHTDVVQAQVMPRDTGELQGNTYVDTSGSKNGSVDIVTPGPYARRLYYHAGYNFRHDKNKSAMGEWYNPWISGRRKNFAAKAFAEFFKKNNGGK